MKSSSVRGWGLPAVLLIIVVVVAVASAAYVGTLRRSTGPEAIFQRGLAAIDAGDPDVARRAADTLMQLPDYELEGRLLRGIALTRSGLFDDALVQLEQASHSEKTIAEASAQAAHCLYATGRYQQAIAAAMAALERDPKRIDARRWLASAYYDLGAISHAIMELDRISAEAPDDPRPSRLLGLIAKDSENYLKATEYYKESLRRDGHQPDRQAILQELAESQITLGQFQEALETLKMQDRTAASLTLEASCQLGLSEKAAARERLQEAVQLDPRYYPANLAQGKLFIDSGEADQAVAVLKKAIEIEPMNSKARLQLSQALRELNRVEEADAELKQMLEVQALEREFSDLHDAAAKQPEDAEVRYRLGDVAVRLEKRDLARMWFKAALGIDDTHAKARAALDSLDRSKGGLAKARDSTP